MLLVLLLIAAFLSIVLQEFLPPLHWLADARILIYPAILFYGALSLRLPGALTLAFACGLMWELANLHHTGGAAPGAGVGWPIALYGLLCLPLQASWLKAPFARGRWEVHCLVSGLGTALIVAAEYVSITLQREGVVLDDAVGWRIAGAGLLALFVAPPVYLLFQLIERAFGIGHAEPTPDPFFR